MDSSNQLIESNNINLQYYKKYMTYKKKYLNLKFGGAQKGETKESNNIDFLRNKLLEIRNSGNLDMLTLRGHGRTMSYVFKVPENVTLLFLTPNKHKSIGKVNSAYILGKSDKHIEILNNLKDFLEGNSDNLNLTGAEDITRFYFPGSIVQDIRINSFLEYKSYLNLKSFNYSGIIPLDVALQKKN